MGTSYDSYRYYGRIIDIENKETFMKDYAKLIGADVEDDYDGNLMDDLYELTEAYEPIKIKDTEIAIVCFGNYMAGDLEFFIGYEMETKSIEKEKKLMGDDIFETVDKQIDMILEQLSSSVLFDKTDKNDIEVLQVIG